MITYAAETKEVSTEKSFWWTVPNGGHSSARIKLSYTEYYVKRTKRSVFKKRTRCILFQRAGATSLPKYSFGTLTHSNGNSFSEWTDVTILYGSSWDSGSEDKNTTKVKYGRNTNVTGTLNAIVVCQGGNIPTRSVSVSQRLNTP